MKLDREKTIELIYIYCNGNYNRFAREIAVDPSRLHKFLTTGAGGGKKMIDSILKYCKVKGLNCEYYVKL